MMDMIPIAVLCIDSADPHSIVSTLMMDQGSGPQLVWTTAAPHGFVGGEGIAVTGTTGGLYDGPSRSVDLVLSPTDWFEAATYLGDSFGGTWS